MARNVLVVFEKPIYLCFEPVDPQIFATGVGATAGLSITVLLRGEGVYYGLKNQKVEGITVGGITPSSEVGATPAQVWTWIAKNTGTKVFAVSEDLAQRSIKKDELTEGVEITELKSVPKLIEDNDAIFVY